MPDENNFQLPPKGFDSYLKGIIPDDQAITAGAFAYSMQQIRNIDKVPAEKFARVAYSMENTVGLDEVNGTNGLPTNQPLRIQAKTIEALGSGPYGTYTMSNFFGAMSGLPYPWQLIQQGILSLQTQKLINIYQELFLAVTWQPYQLKVTQLPLRDGKFYTIVRPYKPPTVSPNPANPDFDPNKEIPNPSFNPSLPPSPTNPEKIPNPDYDPFPYLNGSSGNQTFSPSYYSDAGVQELYDWWYRIEIGEDTPKMKKPWLINGGYGRGNAPIPTALTAIRTEAGTLDPRNVYNSITGAVSSPTGGFVTVSMGRDPYGARSYGNGSYGRLSINRDRSRLESLPWRWLQNDAQQGWLNKEGEDTLVFDGSGDYDDPTNWISNPPTPPSYSGGPYGQYTKLIVEGTGPTSQGRLPPFWSPTGGSGKGGPVGGLRQAMPVESITIEYPPIADLPVTDAGKATNGQNTPGRTTAGLYQTTGLDPWGDTVVIQCLWPPPAPQATIFWPEPGNSVTQKYIDQSNTEIQAIRVRNVQRSDDMNAMWNVSATALKHEQRARYIALNPVAVPWDRRSSAIPMAINTFTDSLPEYAKQTQPHMAVQTLEHISNLNSPGGESVVALMREQRNQARLAQVGIELDNNMPQKLDVATEQRLMLNGTVPGAVEGVPSPNGNVYTIPAWPTPTDPIVYWDCETQTLKTITQVTEGSYIPLISGDGCPIVNPEVPVGPGPEFPPPQDPRDPPDIPGDDDTNPWDPDPDDGGPVVPPFPPPNVNRKYTGTTLLPSTYNPQEAIDKVVECNCDCWID